MSINEIFLLGLLTLDDGASKLSRNVGNKQSTQRNVREERRPQDLQNPVTGELAWASRTAAPVAETSLE